MEDIEKNDDKNKSKKKEDEEDIFDEEISVTYKDRVLDIIKSLDLDSQHKKIIIKNRFLYEVMQYEKKEKIQENIIIHLDL